MLHDYVDDYKGMTLLELYDETPAGMEKKSMSLDKIAGKKAKIAFRYVGIDGNSMFIDAVGVGYPALEDVSYLDPFSTLYWGFTRSASLTCLTADIAMYPVYAPLTWTNMTYIDGAEYEWTYCDPVTADFVTDNNPEALTVTYIPDYSSEASMRNNFFYPPTLTASAPNSTPAATPRLMFISRREERLSVPSTTARSLRLLYSPSHSITADSHLSLAMMKLSVTTRYLYSAITTTPTSIGLTTHSMEPSLWKATTHILKESPTYSWQRKRRS